MAGAFLDKDIYRIYLATLWANAVAAPERSRLTEADLEPFHDFLVERAGEILGGDDCVRDCFRHLISRRWARGDAALSGSAADTANSWSTSYA
ncbi:MAG: hypothetical protein U5R48_15135 [Gammaproteobacteria bacterium]|nr:hypothetical protein [Gammaproteobacteria bacterium]